MSLNKTLLIGHVGADPKTNQTGQGRTVVNFRVATTDYWRDRTTGERREKTEWHHIVCFGNLADFISQYVRKGAQVYIEGSNQTSQWDGEDGQRRYRHEVVARRLELLGGRPRSEKPDDSNDSEASPDNREKPSSNEGAVESFGLDEPGELDETLF